ncbi:MAG: hypothetical protein RTV31_14100, partial [Candidatus Thorarchaeota archaeon]
KFNVLLDNGGSCQLNDDGEDNIFIYNYFSDWLTPDANSDNFVDVPYEADGASDNSDDWPVTVIGYNVSPTNTTSTNSTTSGLGDPSNLTTTLLIAGGAVGVIVLVAGILIVKKR